MRALLTEGDLVCVEVQKICDDGLMRLAARNIKFGKVSNVYFLLLSFVSHTTMVE